MNTCDNCGKEIKKFYPITIKRETGNGPIKMVVCDACLKAISDAFKNVKVTA